MADAAVPEVDELPTRVRAGIDAAVDVRVVTPSLAGPLAWLTYGDDSTLTAFPGGAGLDPTYILLPLRNPEHSSWQERGLIEQDRERFGLPPSTSVIDPTGHVPPGPKQSPRRESGEKDRT